MNEYCSRALNDLGFEDASSHSIYSLYDSIQLKGNPFDDSNLRILPGLLGLAFLDAGVVSAFPT